MRASKTGHVIETDQSEDGGGEKGSELNRGHQDYSWYPEINKLLLDTIVYIKTGHQLHWSLIHGN